VYLCRVIAPFAPFISDYIFKNLTGGESVHLQKYPAYTENTIGTDLLNDMRRVQSIVSVGKQLREKAGIRNRLPLAKLTVAGIDMSEYADIIADEMNVKSVKFTDNVSSVADSFVYLITPKIGARLGGALKDIIPAVKQGNYEINDDKLIAAGQTINADEFENRLTVRDDVTGAALPDNTAVIVLDTELNSELIAEGLANDTLRFIQDTRKTIGLDVSDRINLEYSADIALADALESHRDRIMADALIVDMVRGDGDHTTEIEGYNLSIKITRA